MAGMFYSLQETAERLGKTEDEVRQLTQDGKLREFRDGSNLLFKIQEVNALLAESIDMGAEEELELEKLGETAEQATDNLEAEPVELEESEALLGEAEESGVASGSDEESLALADGSAEEDIFDLEAAPEPAAEAEEEMELSLEEEGTAEPVAEADTAADLGPAEEPSPEVEMAKAGDASSELGLAPVAGEEAGGTGEEDFLLLDEEEQPAASTEGTSDEISLAPESGILASESDITDMDTALTGEGVNVLGDSDAEYDVAADSEAETAAPAGTGTEASLEEIEEDVNLDSFGSGSGLLDLSLQADDTSLGGILDEIYTAEGEGEPGAEGASLDDITAEAEQPVGEEELAVPEPVAVAPMAVAPAYAEALPDTQSNVLGMLLFLPLLALLYTAIVTIAGMRNVMPSILGAIQGRVWYIAGFAIVVALIVTGASFAIGGEKAPRAARPKKEKRAKVKGEKPKKEKKVKAKKEKPAKAKKGLLGKKKG